MYMTKNELHEKLSAMSLGQYASINYDLYEELFPPGEPDERARESCYNFAKELGCRIENKIDLKEVWFVKDA